MLKKFLIFRLLNMMEFGAIRAAYSIGECSKMVNEIIVGPDKFEKKRKEFIIEFLRPRGLEVSAGSAAADEIEILIKNKYEKK